MELKQYASILWRWMWLILLGTMTAGAAAYITSELTWPVYAASTTLLINQAPSDKTTDYTAILTSERLARTYVEMLTTRPVLEEAIQTLRLNMQPDDLAEAVKVTAVRDTQLITVQVENADPGLAAQLANLIPEVFTRQNETLQASRYAATKASLSQQLDALNQQIQQTQAGINATGAPNSASEQAELGRLQSEITQLRTSYTTLLQSYENVRLAEAQSTSNILVVEPARVPTVPVRPKTVQNTLLAAVVGMMLGVGLVFLIEYLDDSIRSPEQITGLLGAPVIGVIARMNGGSHNENGNRSLIAVKQPRSPVVEAFRALRTNIQFTSVDRPVRSLLVTSAVPVEGKSTVSANLAVVMAQAGLRVLLVDCDLRRPSVHKLFDQTNRMGLTDMMLQASAQWDSAAQPTQTPNLSILSSGSLPPNPAELLGSERLRQLLDRLRSNYDMVILDSPPMLPITDATVLARVVDGVLLVVDTGVTRVGAVLQSKELLERVGGRLIGVVMNKVAKGVGGYSHYYHYYDQYDYGGGKHPSSARSKNGRQKMAEAEKAQAEETAASSERV